MKVCIAIRGKHNSEGTWGPSDWKKCYDSLKNNFLNYFTPEDIDIYIQTYQSNEIQKLLDTYKPKNKLIFPISELDKHNQKTNTLNILNIITNPQQYNFIFLTRFDLEYKLPYPKWNIDFSKVTIPFIHPNGGLNDCMFIVPPIHLNLFKESIINYNFGENFHKLPFPRHLIHRMIQQKFFSDTDYPEFFPLNNNPIYKLIRNRRWGFKTREDAFRMAKKQGFIK